jgi:DnaK suppressor protein
MVVKQTNILLKKLANRKITLLKNCFGEQIQKKITDHCADFLSQASLASIQETALVLRDKQLSTLRNIDAAIRRVMDGTYGKCMECDEPIEAARIEAIPEVACCLRCQETSELQAKQTSSSCSLFSTED